jgi:hypothetical protein
MKNSRQESVATLPRRSRSRCMVALGQYEWVGDGRNQAVTGPSTASVTTTTSAAADWIPSIPSNRAIPKYRRVLYGPSTTPYRSCRATSAGAPTVLIPHTQGDGVPTHRPSLCHRTGAKNIAAEHHRRRTFLYPSVNPLAVCPAFSPPSHARGHFFCNAKRRAPGKQGVRGLPTALVAVV